MQIHLCKHFCYTWLIFILIVVYILSVTAVPEGGIQIQTSRRGMMARRPYSPPPPRPGPGNPHPYP